MWSEELLEQFLLLASEKLRGDWVLCGASLLPLLAIKTRTTWDIDFYGLDNPTQSESYVLMEIAESLGAPAECINWSGGYHLSKIKSYRKHLVSLQEDKSRIFRPDLYLFCRLKLQRFTEVDYLDCVELLKNQKTNSKEFLEIQSLTKQHLSNLLSQTSQPEKAKRVVQLMNHLNA